MNREGITDGGGMRHVSLSARVGFRLPIYGPIGIEGRSLWLVGVAAAFLALVVELRILGPYYEMVAGGVLLAGAVVLGRVTREGVWSGTHALYRHVGPRVFPSMLRNGIPLRARVRVVGTAVEADHERPTLTNTRLRRLMPFGGANLARFVAVPELTGVANGLFELSTHGWCGVVALDGPVDALRTGGFQLWCDRLVFQLLSAVGCPVQVVVHREHANRAEAEMAFNRSMVRDGVLVDEERRLCGNVAELTLRMRHLLVLMPGTAGGDGLPDGAFLHRAHRAVRTDRADAERALAAAVRHAPLAGISVSVPSADDVLQMLDETLLRATEASAAPEVVQHSGRHHQTLVVTALGANVMSGVVVDALIAAHCEATASLHLMPMESAALSRYLERQTDLLSLTSTNDEGRVAYRRAVSEHQQLAWELSGQQVSGYRVALSLTVMASSREECAAALDRVRGVLGAARMATEVPTALGFLPALATTPGGLPLGRSVLLTTDDVAAALVPALGTPFSDYRNPYVGIDKDSSGAPVYHTPFAGDSYNLLVAGLGGAGKSVYLQSQMVREDMRGTVFVVLDPKDNEYAAAVRAIGGSYVTLGGGSEEDGSRGGHSLNPFSAGMGLPPVRAAEYILPTLSVMAGDEYGGADGRPITRLDVESQARLNELLVDFLDAYDIESATTEPVVSDLRGFLNGRLTRSAGVGQDHPHALSPKDRDRVEQIAWRLKHYTTGSRGEAFDRPSSFAVGDSTVGIGFGAFAKLYGTDHAAMFAIVLSATLRAMRAKRRRLVLLMDEAHIAFRERAAAEVLDTIIREGRAYHCGVWMASQHPRDFIASEVGRSLAALTTTKVILRLDSSVAQDAREVFDLSRDQLEVLMTSGTKGLAVLWTPTENALIQVDPGPSMLVHSLGAR